VSETFGRWPRPASLGVGGAVAGLLTGWLAHHAARAVLTGIFGRDVPEMGGPIEGLALGATTGVGFAFASGRRGVVLLTGIAAAIGGMGLALAGRHLVGASLDLMAGTFAGSQVGLEPLARLLGEQGLRPMTRLIVSAFEGFFFGGGVAFGLTLRPRDPVDRG
jgi:hypothetical protein